MKSKLTNGIIFALAVIGGLGVFLAVVEAVTNHEDTSYTPTPTYSAPIQDDVQVEYTPPVVDRSDSLGYEYEVIFVDSCSEYSSRGSCKCAYDYLDDNMTNDEFTRFVQSADIESQPIFNDAVNACYLQ